MRYCDYRVMGVCKELRDRFVKYARNLITKKYPEFAMTLNKLGLNLYRLENLSIVSKKHTTRAVGSFELFTVVGSEDCSYLFPNTFSRCVRLRKERGFDILTLLNAPQYAVMHDRIANDQFIVVLDYEDAMRYHILEIGKFCWSSFVLPIHGLSYGLLFWINSVSFMIMVWRNNHSMVMSVDCESKSLCVHMDIPRLDVESTLVMHYDNVVVGFEYDADLDIPIRSRISWIKRFDIASRTWNTVPFEPRTAHGFHQVFVLGDFVMFFIDKFRSIAPLHEGKWRPDVPVPVMGLPPWNSWSVARSGLYVWDVWARRLDVFSYDFLA